MIKRILLTSLAIGLMITSCETEVVYDANQLLAEETASIRDYLSERDIEVEEHPDGFFYRVIYGGDDTRAQNLDWVDFDLSLYDLDDVLYFSTDSGLELRSGIKPPYFGPSFEIIISNSPNKRPLEAIYDIAELIGVGGVIEAYVPSNMAYGLAGYVTSIGGHSGIRRINIPPNLVVRIVAKITQISQ